MKDQLALSLKVFVPPPGRDPPQAPIHPAARLCPRQPQADGTGPLATQKKMEDAAVAMSTFHQTVHNRLSM